MFPEEAAHTSLGGETLRWMFNEHIGRPAMPGSSWRPSPGLILIARGPVERLVGLFFTGLWDSTSYLAMDQKD